MPKKKETLHFKGVSTPNTTQVPDQYLDELLAELTGAELKTLLYITRRTFGFKKQSDNISLSQLLNGITTKDGRVLDKGTGLTKPTLLKALRSLQEMNIIRTERKRSTRKGDEATGYSLVFAEESGGKEIIPPVVKKLYQGRGEDSLPGPVVKKSYPQQTVDIQHTELQHTVRQQSARVVDDLIKIGITESEAIRITNAYPEDEILETLHLVRWLGEHEPQEIKKTPAAFFAWALKGEYDPPTSYQTRADQIAEEEKRQLVANCTICEGRGVYESEKQTSSGRSVMARCDHSGHKREITVGFT